MYQTSHLITTVEQAIEDLRIKYEKKAEAEAKAKEDAKRRERAEDESKPKETDWVIDGDDDLEKLRRVRLGACMLPFRQIVWVRRLITYF